MRSRPRCTSSTVRPCVASRSMESDWRKRASDASSSERTKSSPGCTSGTAERRPALARTTRRSASRTTTKSGQRSMTSDARLSATSPLRLSVYPRRGHRFKRVLRRLQPRASDGSVERKRILVTGAGGLIGSHLCEAFAAAGWEVRALDREGTDCAEARAAGAAVVHADLERQEGALFAAGQARDATLVAHGAFPRARGGGALGAGAATLALELRRLWAAPQPALRRGRAEGPSRRTRRGSLGGGARSLPAAAHARPPACGAAPRAHVRATATARAGRRAGGGGACRARRPRRLVAAPRTRGPPGARRGRGASGAAPRRAWGERARR